ncbi:MAG: YceD family protein [Cyclobacteriaceae bacterium]|jgi:uncharacterized metal-binding protein YceD (DUF177 family)
MGKQEVRDFEIQFVHLPVGEHQYVFDLNPAFFDAFPETMVESGEGKAHLNLLKSETMLTLHFEIEAKLTLTCDVSLREFEQPLQIQRRLMIKFGEEEGELDEEVFIISHEKISINVAAWIHEFINLEIPMKKLHPEIASEERPDMAYSSAIDDETEEAVDPRWEALKKLKNKN